VAPEHRGGGGEKGKGGRGGGGFDQQGEEKILYSPQRTAPDVFHAPAIKERREMYSTRKKKETAARRKRGGEGVLGHLWEMDSY